MRIAVPHHIDLGACGFEAPATSRSQFDRETQLPRTHECLLRVVEANVVIFNHGIGKRFSHISCNRSRAWWRLCRPVQARSFCPAAHFQHRQTQAGRVRFQLLCLAGPAHRFSGNINRCFHACLNLRAPALFCRHARLTKKYPAVGQPPDRHQPARQGLAGTGLYRVFHCC